MGSDAEMDDARRRFPWRIAGWGSAALILLLPLVAMRFTDEVAWGPLDFFVAGILIGGAGVGFELAVRASGNIAYRAGAAVAIGAAFLLVWVNLAVGFFGSENNPANLMFLGVFAVATIASIIARFQAAAMVRAMSATAAAQGMVGVIALGAGLGSAGLSGLYEAVVGTGLFAALWLVSAWLFRTAAREQAAAGAVP